MQRERHVDEVPLDEAGIHRVPGGASLDAARKIEARWHPFFVPRAALPLSLPLPSLQLVPETLRIRSHARRAPHACSIAGL